VRNEVELSKEFILELIEVQQRLFGFLSKRLAKARGPSMTKSEQKAK